MFFNGNTFSFFGRELMLALFSDLPTGRKRELASAVAHCIVGVLDVESMATAVESLCRNASWQPGDRVKTLRGSLCGVMLKMLDDGRVLWRAEGSGTEFIALPESLCRDD